MSKKITFADDITESQTQRCRVCGSTFRLLKDGQPSLRKKLTCIECGAVVCETCVDSAGECLDCRMPDKVTKSRMKKDERDANVQKARISKD